MRASLTRPLIALNWQRLAASGWLANLSLVLSFAVAWVLYEPSEGGTALLLVMVIVNAWVVLWALLDGVHWGALVASWRTWRGEVQLPHLPYALPDSDAARARRRLGTLIAWARDAALPGGGSIGALLAVALVVLILLPALGLGAIAVALSALALLCAQANVWAEHQTHAPLRLRTVVAALTSGALRVALPVLLGHVVVAPVSLPVVALAGSLALAAHPSRAWRDVGHAATIALLLFTRQPIGAFLLAQIWLPQLYFGELRWRLLWQSLAISIALLTLS